MDFITCVSLKIEHLYMSKLGKYRIIYELWRTPLLGNSCKKSHLLVCQQFEFIIFKVKKYHFLFIGQEG